MTDFNNSLIERPNWWKRNWKWFVPVGGCLTLIVIFIVAIGLGAFGIINSVKENTSYDEVLAKVILKSEVAQELGEPIEKNGIGSYKFNYSNGDQTSSAVIPIKGSKGKGEIYVTTTGPKENPVYKKLEVYIEAKDSIITMMPLNEHEQ